MRRFAAVVAALIAVVLAGCGNTRATLHSSGNRGGSGHGKQSASLVLDFTPNPVHVGIYTALARHYDTAAGINLHVVVPGASTDAIRLLETGRVDFAILDIHDLAIARSKHEDVRAVMPIVQRPLASVIAAPSVRSPRQLTGRTVGVTGDPSDLAVLHSIVAGAGGDPSAVKTIDIGYDSVADLVSGRVPAATAFWDDEGVTLKRRKPGFHIFRVDRYGAPSYPELVVCATARSLRRDPSRARALVTALRRGYNAALADPAAGEKALESQVGGLDPSLVSAEMPGLENAFRGPEHRFGVFDVARLRAWASWERRFGIVRTRPDVGAMFDTGL